MILDENVKIKISKKNIEYYSKKFNVKLKDILYICPNELQRGSNKKIKVKCDNCDDENIVKYYSYMNNIENWNIYLCSKCSDKYKMEKIYKTNLEKYGVKIFTNREKSKKTNLEKYGVENVSQCKDIKEKKKETNIKNWGTDNVFQSEKIKEISKKTKKEKYGDENFTNREKSKQTCLMNNGVEYPTQSKYILETRNLNNMKKYGVEHYTQTNECQNKIKNTCFEKYDKYSYLATEDCQIKSRKTCNEKYGVDYPSQNYEIHKKQFPKMKNHNLGIKYQGSYEKDFLDLCEKLKISVERGNTIKYMFNGKEKIYFPDYYIKDFNLLVEIKSSYIFNLNREKNIKKREASIMYNYDFLFIIDKKYDKFISIINKKLNF